MEDGDWRWIDETGIVGGGGGAATSTHSRRRKGRDHWGLAFEWRSEGKDVVGGIVVSDTSSKRRAVYRRRGSGRVRQREREKLKRGAIIRTWDRGVVWGVYASIQIGNNVEVEDQGKCAVYELWVAVFFRSRITHLSGGRGKMNSAEDGLAPTTPILPNVSAYLEFLRGGVRSGRSCKTWRRLGEGWKSGEKKSD